MRGAALPGDERKSQGKSNWRGAGSVVNPDLSQRFTKIIVDGFTSSLPSAPAGALWFAAALFQPSRLDGRHYFWHESTRHSRLHEQATIEEEWGIARILAGFTDRNLFNLATATEKAFGFLLQLLPHIRF